MMKNPAPIRTVLFTAMTLALTLMLSLWPRQNMLALAESSQSSPALRPAIQQSDPLPDPTAQAYHVYAPMIFQAPVVLADAAPQVQTNYTVMPGESIQAAIDKAQAGDVIVLAAGTHVVKGGLRSARSGRADAYITLRGPQSGQAIMRPATSGKVDRLFEINHSFIRLEGFVIDGYDGDGNSAADYNSKLVFVLGKEARSSGGAASIDGLQILRMTLKNASEECVRLRYFVQHAEIAYNSILNCGLVNFRFGGSDKVGEGVYIGTSWKQWGDQKNPNANADESNHNHVHHNLFNQIDTSQSNAGRPVSNECVDIKEGSSGNVVEFNECRGQQDPNSAGFDSRGDGNIIRYNHAYDNVGAGVRLGGCKKGEVDSGMVCPKDYGFDNAVYGNQFEGNQAGGIRFQKSPQGLICGNVGSQNNMAAGDFGSQYMNKVSATCPAGAPATATPAASPTPKPTQTTQPQASPTPPATLVASPTVKPTQTSQPQASPTPPVPPAATATPAANPTLAPTQTGQPQTSPTPPVTPAATGVPSGRCAINQENVVLQAEFGEVAGSMTVFNTRDPSYVVGTSARAIKPVDVNQRVRICVTVRQGGEYKFEGRVLAPDDSSNSFYVQVDDSPIRVWHVPAKASWKTVEMSDEESQRMVMPLTAGTHVVTLYVREPGTQLNWIKLLPVK